MSDNTIKLISKNNRSKIYNIVLIVQKNKNDEKLILYTDDKIDKNDNKNVYAIKLTKSGTYKNVTEKEHNFLSKMLENIQSEGKKNNA